MSDRTTSSAAHSLSRRRRRQTTQTRGLNQKTIRSVCAIMCTIQSRRRTCASSWRNTILARSSGHSDDPAGRMIFGETTPQVTRTDGLLLSSRCTILFNLYSEEIDAVSRLQRPLRIGMEADTTPASRAKPVNSTINPTPTPLTQTIRGNPDAVPAALDARVDG